MKVYKIITKHITKEDYQLLREMMAVKNNQRMQLLILMMMIIIKVEISF